jgi:hypothetical protein
MIETNNQVAVIENSIEILRTAPEILQTNQIRKDKALNVGSSILTAITEEGMTPELDMRAMNYLVNINKAKKEMNESRSSVTQIMDSLKSMYTEVENVLDVKKAGTVPFKIQEHRNAFAKQQAEEQERKRKEAERAAAKAKEAIDIKTDFTNSLNRLFNDYLLNKKQKFQQKFNALTLDTFADDAAALRQYQPNFTVDQFNGLYVSPSSRVYHSAIEQNTFLNEVRESLFDQFASTYVTEMTALKNDVVEKLASKRTELLEQKRLADEAAEAKERARIAEEKRQEEIKHANAAKKKQLEEEARIAREQEAIRMEELRKQQAAADAERKQREAEENERLMKEAADAKIKAEQEAEIKRQGEQTMVLFEQEAAMATETAAPEVRQGYEIEILHPVACTQIFALWFENEGKNLPVDKILNTKVEQMKAWAEKHAHKNNVKIESKFLKYNESFKAVNRKVK